MLAASLLFRHNMQTARGHHSRGSQPTAQAVPVASESLP
jgi:hypothetical protein